MSPAQEVLGELLRDETQLQEEPDGAPAGGSAKDPAKLSVTITVWSSGDELGRFVEVFNPFPRTMPLSVEVDDEAYGVDLEPASMNTVLIR